MINTSTLVPTGSSRIPNWVSGGSYVVNDQVMSPITFLAYVRKTNGGGVTDPSADSTNWTPFGLTIKSIQRGVISFNQVSSPGTATISSVNTSKSLIFYLGAHGSSGTAFFASIALTNSTTVTASASFAGAQTATIGYQVVEYY